MDVLDLEKMKNFVFVFESRCDLKEQVEFGVVMPGHLHHFEFAIDEVSVQELTGDMDVVE